MSRELDMMERAVRQAQQGLGAPFVPGSFPSNVLEEIRALGWELVPPPRFLARPIICTLDWEVVDTVSDERLRVFEWEKCKEAGLRAAQVAELYAEGVAVGFERQADQ